MFGAFQYKRKSIVVYLSVSEIPQRVSVSGITYVKFPAVKSHQ